MDLVTGQTVSTITPDWSTGTLATALDLPSSATAGNLIIVWIYSGHASRTISSVDDAGSTTYAAMDGGGEQVGGAGRVNLWWGIAAGAGAGTDISVVLSGGSGDGGGVAAAEFSSAAADQSTRTDNGATFTATTGNHDSGSVTPATASNNVIACAAGRSGGDWTGDADFTHIVAGDNFRAAYLLNAAGATSYLMVSDANEDSALRIGAFVGASSATAHIPAYLQMLRANQ